MVATAKEAAQKRRRLRETCGKWGESRGGRTRTTEGFPGHGAGGHGGSQGCHLPSTLSSTPQVESIQVPNQEFGLSEKEPGTNFVYAQFDGIMGLAYPALSMGGATTALQGMLRVDALSSPIFSVYLSK